MTRRKNSGARGTNPTSTKPRQPARNNRPSMEVEPPAGLAKARQALQQARGVGDSLNAAKAVLEIEPTDVEALRRTGEAQVVGQAPEKAVETFARALRVSPDDELLLERYVGQAAKIGALWDALCAARHWVDIAQEKPALALRLLSGLYGLIGREEASKKWAAQVALLEPMREEPAKGKERLRVLVLDTITSGTYRLQPKTGAINIGEGHNNLTQMLDRSAITRYRFSVDRVDDHPELLDQIPEVDLIYNEITDASRCEKALHKAQKLCDQVSVPVINRPSEVLRTTREENAERLGNLEGLLVPGSFPLGELEGEIKDTVKEAVDRNGLKPPVIIRAAGFQNGKNMHLIDEPGNVSVRLSDRVGVYLLQYHDVTYTDSRAPGHRLHPKYRAFMVGGKLYPVHLRVGHDGDWNVHMDESKRTFARFPWLYDDEQDFIEDPAAQFEPGCWERLEKALQTIDLDYFGVDFAICTEPEHKGKIVIFEANASMRNFVLQTYQNTPENTAAHRVVRAAHELFCDRAQIPRWDFDLPRGRSGPAQEQDLEAGKAKAVAQQILFSGKVQDVGFRQWLWHELHKHSLSGWVRRLEDGRVEAVAAGSTKALDHLLKHGKGPEKAQIKNREVRDWNGPHPQGVRVLANADAPAQASEDVAEAARE